MNITTVALHPGQSRSDMPPLQALLLWQSLCLFWFLGILSLRWPVPCACLAVIFIFIDRRLRNIMSLLTATLIFIMAFAVAHTQLEPRPPTPSWAFSAENRPLSMTWEGTVINVQSLTDMRLRIFLKNIVGIDAHGYRHTLNGKGIWTWDTSESVFSPSPSDHRPILTSTKSPVHSPVRPIAGHTVRFTSKLYTSASFHNFFAPSYGFYWQSKDIFWRFWSREQGDSRQIQIVGIPRTSARTRESIRQRFEQAVFPSNTALSPIEQQARAFLPALLFGDKFFLNNQTMTRMAEASLVHSLALSGQHLALAGLLACIVVYILRCIFPFIYLSLPKKHLLACISVCFALFYVWIGNAPPSLLRASVMLVVGVFLFWYGKPNKTLADILFATVFLLSVYNPMVLFDVGFQLSVLCVGSIALVLPLVQRIPVPPDYFKEVAPIRGAAIAGLRALLQILLISLTIQVVMMPVFFYYFSPSGEWFISNVLWLPILSFWVLPLTALSCFMAYVFPHTPFISALVSLTALPCQWLLQFLQWVEPFFVQSAVLRPHWTVLPAFASLCIACALLIGRQKDNYPAYFYRLLMISALFFCVAPLLRFADNWCTHIEMFDVGQGQAIYISLPGGQRLLIDGGGGFSPRFDVGKSLVVPRLVSNTAPHMHALVNTHPDADHTRGLLGVMESMNVDALYTNGQAWVDEDINRYARIDGAPPIEQLHAGMRIPISETTLPFMPQYSIEVLHPPQQTASTMQSTNNASLVLRLVEHKGQETRGLVLLCGDIQKTATRALLASQQDLSAEVLVVPHHGAASSFVPALYDAVQPRIALVSAGRHNAYGFPNKNVENALRKRDIALLSTNKDGAIRIHFWPYFFVTRQKEKAIFLF